MFILFSVKLCFRWKVELYLPDMFMSVQMCPGVISCQQFRMWIWARLWMCWWGIQGPLEDQVCRSGAHYRSWALKPVWSGGQWDRVSHSSSTSCINIHTCRHTHTSASAHTENLWKHQSRWPEAAETEAAETEAPETEAAETEAAETEAPETEAPETEAPETEAPETEAAEFTWSFGPICQNRILQTWSDVSYHVIT